MKKGGGEGRGGGEGGRVLCHVQVWMGERKRGGEGKEGEGGEAKGKGMGR